MLDESYQLDTTTTFKDRWLCIEDEFGSHNHTASDTYVYNAGNSAGLKVTGTPVGTFLNRVCEEGIQRTDDVDRKDWGVDLVMTVNFGCDDLIVNDNIYFNFGLLVEYDTNKICLLHLQLGLLYSSNDLYVYRYQILDITTSSQTQLESFQDDWELNLVPENDTGYDTYHAEIHIGVRFMTLNDTIIMYPTASIIDLNNVNTEYEVPNEENDYRSSGDDQLTKYGDSPIHPFFGLWTGNQSAHVYLEKVTLQ